MIAKNPSGLTLINENHTFLAYDKGSKENILFLGSCRMSPLMFYYSNINSNFNIYNIYTPFWGDETKRNNFPIKKIESILKDTKIIITETISSYGILNTNHKLNNNFFEIFNAKNIEEFRIPNLHLSIYLYDIVNLLKKPQEEHRSAFEESLERLRKSCETKSFEQLYEFIENNISEIRMFYTFNHPSKILSMLTFKILMSKLGQQIPDNFFQNAKQYNFLERHCSPITKKDVEVYNFTFFTKIFDNSILEQPEFRYIMSPEELEIPEKYLKII